MPRKLPPKLTKDKVARQRVRLCRKDIAHVMETLLECTDLKKVTRYVSPEFIVRATRGLKHDRRDRSWTILFTFGKPNYREREFVRTCKKAGEPFPVKKLQLVWHRG